MVQLIQRIFGCREKSNVEGSLMPEEGHHGWRLFGGSAVIMEHGAKTHSQSSDVSSTRQIRLRNSCGSKAGGGNMYRTFFSVTSCERQQVVQNNLLVITSLPEQNIQHIPHDQHMNLGCRFVRLKFIYG
ncbi:hypothetical protein GOODEAATRI_003890 [Goodea atripinnis]|uniref:Uncharacterized protein n=1 Tax=Goodea atripinnis TaxID=208336 RepID=A0ABV0PKS5_9TELE